MNNSDNISQVKTTDAPNPQRKRRGDDEIISIQDALQDHIDNQQHLLDEALHQHSEKWGDEEHCTFEKGYVTQPVYSCGTCNKNNQKSGTSNTGLEGVFGFCYGCSMQCHLYHDVYELFKKRSFRCDCGTLKSGGKCCIQNDKQGSENNTENHYNHNFLGRYCYCDSLYDYVEDMIQCIFCLDWYHEKCVQLNSNYPYAPDPNEFDDFVCRDCVTKHHSILFQYYPQIRLDIKEEEEDEENKDNVKKEEVQQQDDKDKEIKKEKEIVIDEICKKNSFGKSDVKLDLFCKEGWRDQLCKCVDCMKLYNDNKFDFLFKLEEIEVGLEEEEEKEQGEEGKIKEIFQKSEQLFESMVPQTHQRALLDGYATMKDNLRELFAEKQNNNQVITKQDIQSFFNNLKSKKLKL
ncbi:ubiquitin protein ligase E3 component n-recognin 7 [Tieghemostelium lacteum]|uniref:Ubiquitin protein ligase E3 component n-recognin 7 n=1 Tax=Tieghemostelium lacteum TaxID=361077 RepID=A0A151Z9W3_TIELA|nr:ubiquitin protein ligase E3 component n-recognin 7 [Tieghemostelium lacteum]|eukprot:KYQ90741.1 ubiquitin protein ligase E3 component n-recognin 7 [Tieghemostelium lacteum]